MLRRLMLLVVVLAAGFVPLAQAVPCIMQQHMAGGEPCIHESNPQDMSASSGMSVDECFKQPSLPASPLGVTVSAADTQQSVLAILVEPVQPTGLLRQEVTRPPPKPDVALYSTINEFLASLSRWLI